MMIARGPMSNRGCSGRTASLRTLVLACATLATGLIASQPALAQTAGSTLKIGVLTDETGPYADASGRGSILAAQMAVDDFGGKAMGRTVEIVHADTQNKPDVAATIARRWYERENVSAIVDLPLTPVAIAVQQLSKQLNRTVMITASATSDFTSQRCSPVSSHWADDTRALAAGTAKALSARGPASWFFITVDISFGAALQRDATDVIEASGGKVLGSVRHPPNNSDFASQLLQAQSSGARYIGLASVGGDLVNIVKQASEFGIGRDGKQLLVGFLIYINDIDALGLDVAQGLTVTSGFYWDQSDAARAFSKRFFEKQHAMPSKDQAEVYVAVRRFLTSVEATRTDEAVAVNQHMRATAFDYFGKPASVRSDGRVLYDLALYQVKTKAESKYSWDYYRKVEVVSQADAFLPVNHAVCGD
jgi:branched-chain amino acid transport system substrate-binding protein